MPQSIEITTAQNVTLDYQLANLGDRILAFIIDTLIKGAYVLLIFLAIIPQASDGFSNTLMAIGFVVSLPVIFYSLIFEVLNDGQTPGKRAMSIKVVHLEGEEVPFSGYFLRWLFRIVDILLMSGIIGVLAIALSEKGQRVGDAVANTTVISLKKSSTMEQTAFVAIQDNYVPTYPGAASLAASDIVTIKEVLNLRGEEGFAMKLKLSEKLEAVLNSKKNSSSEDFLKQVVKDFNFYQQNDF